MSISSLHSDRRGVTAVEFAIILPGLLTLICGSIEVGHMIFARVALEGAVVEASRLATASLETAESTRTTTMRNYITKTMQPFPTAPNKTIVIETKVYRDFNTVRPEDYNDVNRDGGWDLGEPYTDRNQNGRWDPSSPIGGTLGGPGDVVSYSAVYPKRILFRFLAQPLGLGTEIPLRATTVVRNESVVRRGS